MNFSLPKIIKFPFKKVKNVCTTEQVIHRVDGQDKKLSDMLNSYDQVPITINGKNPIEYIEDGLAFIHLAKLIKNALDYAYLYCLYPNISVNIEVTTLDEKNADIDLQGVFYSSINVGVELDPETGEHQVVVGEFVVIYPTPEYISSFVQDEIGPRVREELETLDSDDMQTIIDYFNAQDSND